MDCNEQLLKFQFIWCFYSLSSLHVDIISIFMYVAHGSEHRWLFNALKLFLIQQ